MPATRLMGSNQVQRCDVIVTMNDAGRVAAPLQVLLLGGPRSQDWGEGEEQHERNGTRERSTTGQEERTMDQPLRVYLMDDDLASATHVLSVLEELPWVQVVGGTSNPVGALREIPELAVDAIFLDVELPGMSGFELLGRLPVKPAIVIVAKPEPQYALTAFRIQAVDFVSKPASRKDLLKATVKVGMRLGRLDDWLPPGAFEDMKALDG